MMQEIAKRLANVAALPVALLMVLSVCAGAAWADDIEVVTRDPADVPDVYRDGEGLWRDTKYFLGYQVGAIAIL